MLLRYIWTLEKFDKTCAPLCRVVNVMFDDQGWTKQLQAGLIRLRCVIGIDDNVVHILRTLAWYNDRNTVTRRCHETELQMLFTITTITKDPLNHDVCEDEDNFDSRAVAVSCTSQVYYLRGSQRHFTSFQMSSMGSTCSWVSSSDESFHLSPGSAFCGDCVTLHFLFEGVQSPPLGRCE